MYAVILTAQAVRVRKATSCRSRSSTRPGGRPISTASSSSRRGGRPGGDPALDNAMVLGLVLENYRDERSSSSRRREGNSTGGPRSRQYMTKVRITRITPDRTLITAEDLAEEKLAPVESPFRPQAEARAAPARRRKARPRASGQEGRGQEGAGQAQGVKKPLPEEESDQGVSHGHKKAGGAGKTDATAPGRGSASNAMAPGRQGRLDHRSPEGTPIKPGPNVGGPRTTPLRHGHGTVRFADKGARGNSSPSSRLRKASIPLFVDQSPSR